jgi:hypothetical protein
MVWNLPNTWSLWVCRRSPEAIMAGSLCSNSPRKTSVNILLGQFKWLRSSCKTFLERIHFVCEMQCKPRETLHIRTHTFSNKSHLQAPIGRVCDASQDLQDELEQLNEIKTRQEQYENYYMRSRYPATQFDHEFDRVTSIV